MNCGINRIIQFKEAIVYQSISIINAEGQDITNNCLFSWSSDGVCWTNWATYNDYNHICKNIESDYYLKILLKDSLGDVLLNNAQTNCYSICIDSSNLFLQNFCENENLFQPYNNLECALQLQQQLSDSVICLFGIPIYYFKVSPNSESADYTFKEYSLHNVVDVKQIKLMIPDGQMPSSNPKLTEFDFDWETDWETEVSKSQFAAAFGDDAIPTYRDFIYIPMMKRMWEVNSAYDEKNESLMWRSTTWKLSLVKYNESTNIETGQFENLIDNWVVNKYDEVFGNIEQIEQKRETGYDQIEYPKFAATNLYDIFMSDSIRKQFTMDDITILDKMMCHKNNIVTRNQYKFKNNNGCITYQQGICGDSGVISFIFEVGGSVGDLDKEIMNIGNIDIQLGYLKDKNKFVIGCHELHTEIDPFSIYLFIYKWNRKTFTTELNVYKYIHKENIPIYMLKPEMYWFDFENPICESVGVYNNDYIMDKPNPIQIQPYPLMISNLKIYNSYLDKQDILKESMKYTTKHENCIINDLARPLNNGHGYEIK